MAGKTVTIGLIQASVSDSTGANLKGAMAKIRDAAGRGAQIICLQELFRTRYFPQHAKIDAGNLAETIPGESTSAMSALARELAVALIVPVFERGRDGRYYNSAGVIDADGSLLGVYRKVHIPNDQFFYEKGYFEPGDLGYPVFRTRYASLSVLICYDQWFPEAARACALGGADIIFYPSAIGYPSDGSYSSEDWRAAWETVQRSHAIANGVHVAAVNRVGTEGNIEFWGSSFVCDAFGRVLERAGPGSEEVIIARVDTSQNKSVREGWGFFSNRRPDTYDILVSHRTPLRSGYRMPAEWEKHEATWLSWPHEVLTFPNGIERVEKTYAEMIGALSKGERIELFVRDAKMKARAVSILEENGVGTSGVAFHEWDYADVWMRDYGPIFVVNRSLKRLAMVHWAFDAWGGKYEGLMRDTLIPEEINRIIGLQRFVPGMVLEGGSIEVNGAGTLLTTEQCLLNKNRNPSMSKSDIEQRLIDYLGVSNVIWLRGGIAGDDTDGHVDDVARFVDPHTVVCAYENDAEDENHAVLEENYRILRASIDQDGNPLKVVRLPMPPKIEGTFDGDATRLPASHLNFYVGNSVVLVPVFGHASDRIALRELQMAFPNREVIGINCVHLVQGLGAIHCVTQQQPLC